MRISLIISLTCRNYHASDFERRSSLENLVEGGMFTGIVDHTGVITSVTVSPTSRSYQIESQFKDLKKGESISVNGVCLTVTDYKKGAFGVDVSPETLRLTNFDILAKDSVVNLERAMAFGDRFGGHWVTGHVDSTLEVEAVRMENGYLELRFTGVTTAFRKLLHKKGSVTLNGVSLTVNELSAQKDALSVLLIPHTLERTNLKNLGAGSKVNVEYDWMAKVILDRLEETLPSLTQPMHSIFERGRHIEDI